MHDDVARVIALKKPLVMQLANGPKIKQDTTAYHKVNLICFLMTLATFNVHTWHHLVHATQMKLFNVKSTARI